MTNFSTTLSVDQTPKEVFDAINNVGGWWHGKIEGNSEALNDTFTYRMEPFHFSKQKVIEIIPNKKIVWLVTESELNFIEDKSEWTGTKISFEISEAGDKTELRFTHDGLFPNMQCYKDCSNGWSMLIHESLLSLIKTAKGKEVFN